MRADRVYPYSKGAAKIGGPIAYDVRVERFMTTHNERWCSADRNRR